MLSGALREALASRGLTASELSRLSGVHRVTISQVMTGTRRSFSKSAAPKIHSALGGALSVTELAGIESEPRPKKRSA